MQSMKWIWTFIFLFLPSILCAHPSSELQQEVLLNFKNELMTAVNQNKLDRFSDSFLPESTIIIENGHIFHSQDELKDFVKSTNQIEGFKIKKFTIEKVDFDKEITNVDESTFIASGTALFQYQLVKGKTIKVHLRWSATITQVIDKWKIAGFQNTVNVLVNPIIEEMQTDFYMMCFIAFIIGIIIGYAWKKMLRKKI